MVLQELSSEIIPKALRLHTASLLPDTPLLLTSLFMNGEYVLAVFCIKSGFLGLAFELTFSHCFSSSTSYSNPVPLGVLSCLSGVLHYLFSSPTSCSKLILLSKPRKKVIWFIVSLILLEESDIFIPLCFIFSPVLFVCRHLIFLSLGQSHYFLISRPQCLVQCLVLLISQVHFG